MSQNWAIDYTDEFTSALNAYNNELDSLCDEARKDWLVEGFADDVDGFAKLLNKLEDLETGNLDPSTFPLCKDKTLRCLRAGDWEARFKLKGTMCSGLLLLHPNDSR